MRGKRSKTNLVIIVTPRGKSTQNPQPWEDIVAKGKTRNRSTDFLQEKMGIFLYDGKRTDAGGDQHPALTPDSLHFRMLSHDLALKPAKQILYPHRR